MYGSIITVVDSSKYQPSKCKIKALDVSTLESELIYFCSRYRNVYFSALAFIMSFLSSYEYVPIYV